MSTATDNALNRIYDLYLDGYPMWTISQFFEVSKDTVMMALHHGRITESSAKRVNATTGRPDVTPIMKSRLVADEFPHFMAILNDRDIAVRMLAKAYGMNEKAIGKSISSANGPSRVKAARKRQALCELILARVDGRG